MLYARWQRAPLGDRLPLNRHLGAEHLRSIPIQTPVHAMITANNYKSAIIKTIKAGGCNCSRAVQVGCLLGAIYGEEKIPRKWIEATHSAAEIQSITGKLSNELGSQAA